MRNKATLYFSSLYIVPILLLHFAANAQNTFTKGIDQPAYEEIGCHFVQFEPDSMLWLNKINDVATGLDAGFEWYKSDTSLNFSSAMRYLNTNSEFYSINQIDSSTFIVSGQSRDTFQVSPTFNYVTRCFTAIMINRQGDTLWCKRYTESTLYFDWISLEYTGKISDTLIFSGSTITAAGSDTTCGMLLYLNAKNGNLISVFSYCDSFFHYTPYRSAFDPVKRIIMWAGDRDSLDGTRRPEVFYAELNLEGDVLQARKISDSASIGHIGALNYSETSNSIFVSYEVYKYPQPAGNHYEMLILDSNRQVGLCKYLFNPTPGTSYILYDVERLDSLGIYRLWHSRYFIDIDDSFNYIDGKLIHATLPFSNHGVRFWKTFRNGIYGVGLYKTNNFSKWSFLAVKADAMGNGCFSDNLNGTWNLLNGQVPFTRITIQKSVNSQIIEKPLTLSYGPFIINDSSYCITTGEGVLTSPASDWMIYPNPAKDQLFIQSNTNHLQQLRIADINGRVVFTENFKEVNAGIPLEINISQLPSGNFYTVHLLDHYGNQVTRKFIKL